MVRQTLPSPTHDRERRSTSPGESRRPLRPLYAVSALTPGLLYYALSQQTALTPAAMLLLSAAAAPTVFLLLRPFALRLPELEDAPREE